MKVLVAELSQESNSFCPVLTTLEDYRRYGIVTGNAYRQAVKGIRIESEGIFTALEEAGIDYVPAIRMRAQAGGKILPEVYDHLMETIRETVRTSGPFDGAFLSLHGATQSTLSDDVCGDVVCGVRELLGPKAVIVSSFDLHANITRRIFDNADFVCGYQTYPHIDFYETGYRASKLGCEKLLGKKHNYMAWCPVPLIEPASGYTTETGAFGAMVARARKTLADGEISDYTVFNMQPWLDVKAGGSAVVVIAEDRQKAAAVCADLAEEYKSIRNRMSPELFSAGEIISAARKNTSGKPIILVDFSDSANAGAAGDNSNVLEAMLGADATDIPTALIVTDTPAVMKAFETGVGNTADFRLGGTRDHRCSHPVAVRAQVRSLHDGDFRLEGPSRGLVRHIGKCAVISVGQIDILVTQAMASTGDTGLYRHFGIEPAFYKLVMVKANTSFYASYGSILSEVMFIDTGCAATADLVHLPFERLPRPFYPFDDISSFDVEANVFTKG